MSDQFVRVTIALFLKNPLPYFERLRDQAAEEGSEILRKEEEQSIRVSWYREGRTLRSLKDRMDTKGPARLYRLFPTAPHAAFGEYGTGRRGAATGGPAPEGWKYGPKPGMRARRYSRIAVENARPKIIRVSKEVAREFARNVTVR